MTATFRRGGSFVALQWTGDVQAGDFADRLQARRFRTIQNAASEEISIGWVTAADPSGDTITPEDLDAGPATWLRMRVDKKALPKQWWRLHLAAAERAKGGKLSGKERRQLKDDLCEQLLPRVLPTVQHIEALLYHSERLVLLFTAGNSGREAFCKLWFETFAAPLDQVGPLELGLRLLKGAAAKRLQKDIQPVRWPEGRKGGQKK